jgi:hypothetical protein
MYSVEHLTEVSAKFFMSSEKQHSKRKRRRKTAPMLGAAGLSLSLATGASATMSGTTTDMPMRTAAVSHEITPAEEEISDVSLATFYVLDKESHGAFRPGRRFAMGGTCGGCGGCGCWNGNSYSAPAPGSHTGAPHNAVHVHKDERNPKKP